MNKLRKEMFGFRIKDVETYFRELRGRLKYEEQLRERTLHTERSKLSALLDEEYQLLEEIAERKRRLAAIASGTFTEENKKPTLSTGKQNVNEMRNTPLGQLLVERNEITEEQLLSALAFQTKNGGRLGDILVEFYEVDPRVILQVMEGQVQHVKLGEMLMQEGLITSEELDEALAFQKISGGKIGEILTSLSIVKPSELYRLLATQNRMGRIGTQLIEKDIPKLPEKLSRTLKSIVIGERGTRYVVAVGASLKTSDVERLEGFLNKEIEQVLASPGEMQHYWDSVYPEEQMLISTRSMIEDQPTNSAHVTFTMPQMIAICSAVLLFSAFLFVDWRMTLVVANVFVQLFYFMMNLFKAYILMKGTDRNNQIRFEDEALDQMDETKLPIYTILVPMYKEANIIPSLINHLEKLDYPKFKLDIRLLLEEDDEEAIGVVRNMDLPSYYSLIVVPHSLPKTKPKACNYGLIHARGEYTVIFDAEDRPDPYQLKKAILAFASLPDHYVCIQAKLNYFNSEQNLLTRWFTQEYSMWFELLLPGVMKLDVPIPLGGTSNHFKTEILKKMQSWDPYNVTEDADLGVRLYKNGYKTAIIDSVTWEEANSEVGNWIRQRSRWIKGYMQTWLVHMRNPYRLWKELGAKGFWGFQAMVLAAPTLPVINPILWLLLILWYGWNQSFIPQFFPGFVYYLAAFMFFVGNFVFVFSQAVGMHWVIQQSQEKGDRTFSFRIVKFALLTPIYWILMSVAAMKACWQLITKPFYWEKTDHGLTGEKRQ